MEDPSYLLKIIADLMDSPGYQEIRVKQKEHNKQARQEINQTLSFLIVRWLSGWWIKPLRVPKNAKWVNRN